MKVVSIEYPVPLNKVSDVLDDNIDVFVTLEDGVTYSVVVFTPKNFISCMDNNGLDYLPPSPPPIIVRSLTQENIENAILAYAEDNAFWLKVIYLAGGGLSNFNIEEINKAVRNINEIDVE